MIDYPGKLTTRRADLPTTKILWNSTLSMPGAKYSMIDVNNFYLATSLDWCKYMCIKDKLVQRNSSTCTNYMTKYTKLWKSVEAANDFHLQAH